MSHFEDAKKSLVKAFANGELKNKVYRKICIELVEAPLMRHLADSTNGNQAKTARILGLNRSTVRKMAERSGVLKLFLAR